MPPHLQSIERACQKAIPSILTHEIEHYQGPDSPPEVEPVYRPITLQDILLALGEESTRLEYCITNKGNFYKTDGDIVGALLCSYDLTKSPYDQLPEVLQFLAENLTK